MKISLAAIALLAGFLGGVITMEVKGRSAELVCETKVKPDVEVATLKRDITALRRQVVALKGQAATFRECGALVWEAWATLESRKSGFVADTIAQLEGLHAECFE